MKGSSLILVPALLFGGVLAAAAENWPRFRGSEGRGVSAREVPVRLDEGSRRWSVGLPGGGSGSPVVWGDQVFVTGEDRAKGLLHCTAIERETGEVRWSRAFSVGEYHLHRFNNTASGTPAVAGDRVVVTWYDGEAEVLMLTALDFAGESVWEVKLDRFKGQHGPSVSPVIEGGRVITAHLHQAGGFIYCHDLADGREHWKVPYPGGAKTSYATPLVRDGVDGREVVVSGTTAGLLALALEDGVERWALPGLLDARAICSPVEFEAGSVGPLIHVGCKNAPHLAVRPPTVAGEVPEVAWRFEGRPPYVPVPVAFEDEVHVLGDGGRLAVVDAATGAIVREHRLPGNFLASPIVAGGRLYCQSREGEMFVLDGGDEPLVSDLRPGPDCAWADATPVAVDGQLLIRLGARLDCYGP